MFVHQVVADGLGSSKPGANRRGGRGAKGRRGSLGSRPSAPIAHRLPFESRTRAGGTPPLSVHIDERRLANRRHLAGPPSCGIRTGAEPMGAEGRDPSDPWSPLAPRPPRRLAPCLLGPPVGHHLMKRSIQVRATTSRRLSERKEVGREGPENWAQCRAPVESAARHRECSPARERLGVRRPSAAHVQTAVLQHSETSSTRVTPGRAEAGRRLSAMRCAGPEAGTGLRGWSPPAAENPAHAPRNRPRQADSPNDGPSLALARPGSGLPESPEPGAEAEELRVASMASTNRTTRWE